MHSAFAWLKVFAEKAARRSPTIKTMAIGSVAFAPQSALRRDDNGKYWLLPHSPISQRSGPRFLQGYEIRLERTTHGYLVTLASGHLDQTVRAHLKSS